MNRALLISAAALVLSSCATMSKDAFIQENTSTFRYLKPLPEVLTETTKVLEEKGYFVRHVPGERVITTEWKEEMGNSEIAAAYSRYMVESFVLKDGSSQIRIHLQTSTAGSGNPINVSAIEVDRSVEPDGRFAPVGTQIGTTSRAEASIQDKNDNLAGKRAANAMVTRDLRMEWLVLQRISPDDAKELQALADSRFK